MPFPLVDGLIRYRGIRDHGVRNCAHCWFWWVSISHVITVISGPKFTRFFSSNVGGIAIDNAVPEIFAITSYFGDFLPSTILGRGRQKLYPYSHACLATCHVEKFGEHIPLGPKVITANTLNFKPILEFSLLEIAGRLSSPVRCGLATLCHSLARVKIWEGSTP